MHDELWPLPLPKVQLLASTDPPALGAGNVMLHDIPAGRLELTNAIVLPPTTQVLFEAALTVGFWVPESKPSVIEKLPDPLHGLWLSTFAVA